MNLFDKIFKHKEIENNIPKKNYGKYLIIFASLASLFGIFREKITPHSLSTSLSFFVTLLEFLLGATVTYFLILWIVDLIRRRGGIQRKENEKVKIIVNSIFIFICVTMVLSLALVVNNQSNEKPTIFKEFSQKQSELTSLNDEQKLIITNFANTQNDQQMKAVLSDLLINTSKIQIKINELRLFAEQGLDLVTNKQEQKVLDDFKHILDLRTEHNEKIIELATLGLQIEWGSTNKSQIAKWEKISQEILTIETEILNYKNNAY